jgi:thymidylate kinase
MSILKEIRTIFSEFNKEKIRYIVLRNYEFLTNSKEPKGTDLDITINRKDYQKAQKILIEKGFRKSNPNFSKKHQGYYKYLKKEKTIVVFDIQVGGIYWNDMAYLSDEEIDKTKKKLKDFFVLSDENQYVHYLCHSIFGKRKFKEKYKQKLVELDLIFRGKDRNKKENRFFIEIHKKLSKIINKKVATKLIKLVHKKKFKLIEKKAKCMALKYMVKNCNHFWISVKLFLRWFFSNKYCPLRKVGILRYLLKSKPMISVIGPDGSGKSTMTDMLVQMLKNSGYKVKLVYSGRGKKNIIPIKKVGNIYKKAEKKKKINKNLVKLFYTLSAPIYTLDLLIRYYLQILPLRKKGNIVVTDRYCSDILLMNHVPFIFKKILMFPFPKPTLTFYLYNDPQVLYERKYDQSPKELARQMKLFGHLVKSFKAISIRTESKENNFNEIGEKALVKLSIM